MTPAEMDACATSGRYWYMRPADGTFYGAAEQVPESPGDVYLLDASPEWAAQWPDWTAAAAVMAQIFDRLDEYRL